MSSSKRRKLDVGDEALLSGAVGTHPLGVQPHGNLLALEAKSVEAAVADRYNGLGRFAALPETVLLEFLQRLLPETLSKLAGASTFLRAYATHDDLWRPHVLERLKDGGTIKGLGAGWHRCFVASVGGPAVAARASTLTHRSTLATDGATIRCSTPLYSDVLYAPWVLTAAAYPSAWTNEHGDVPRRTSLTVDEFRDVYEHPNTPVIVTDWTDGWSAHERWVPDALERTHGDALLEIFDDYAGPVAIPLSAYLQYARSCTDERPLYLFDRWFCENYPELTDDYKVPPAFEDDLFAVLGKARPDYRWLLVGPKGSGAAFHIDPNGTSAWNAVIQGKKKWILFPPDVTPPGVHDNGDVDATSVVDWFHRYFVQIEHAVQEGRAGGKGPWQCVVNPGELLFIPRGWWHMALNLELTVAVTHNLAAPSTVSDVLEFLSKHKDQACPSTALMSAGNRGQDYDLHGEFLAAIKERRPEVLEAATTAASAKTTAISSGHAVPFSFNF